MRYVTAIILIVGTSVACVGGPSTPTTVHREASQVPGPASSPVPAATAEPRATPTPEPTPTSTPSAKQSIADFTYAALELEGKRDKVVEQVTGYWVGIGSRRWNAYGMKGEGLAFLLGELALLDAPAQLHSVKDALLTVYRLELDAVVEHGECTWWELHEDYFGVELRCDSYPVRVLPEVTRENAESVVAEGKVTDGGWAAAQLLRAKTYERWREVLEDVGIDLTGYPYNRLK